MKLRDYTEANRRAWNEVAPIHRKARKHDLRQCFKEPSFSVLDKKITARLQQIPITGKRIAQLCCNNGAETLSIVNLGAASAMGFDICDQAIAEAGELAEVSGLPCAFIRADVYEIGKACHNSFDLVYISVGSLGNLPDLERFFDVVAKLLKPLGLLVIYEMHPFADVLVGERETGFEPSNPLKIMNSYFRKQPFVFNTGLDYIGKSVYSAEPHYWFHHTLADIFGAVLGNRIAIREFQEFADDISLLFEHIEAQRKIPLSYLLVGEK